MNDALMASLPGKVVDYGELEESYHPSMFFLQRPVTQLVLAAAFLAGMIGVIMMGMKATPYQTPQRVAFTVSALLLAAVASFLAGRAIRFWYHPYDNGLHFLFFTKRLVLLSDGRVSSIPWAEVELRRVCADPRCRDRYKLHGVPVLDRPPGIAALVRRLREELLLEMKDTIKSGGEVKLGVVTLSKRGLERGPRTAEWKHIKNMKFSYAKLREDQHTHVPLELEVVPKTGATWIKINVSNDIPNAWLFLDLVDHFQPNAIGGSSRRDAEWAVT